MKRPNKADITEKLVISSKNGIENSEIEDKTKLTLTTNIESTQARSDIKPKKSFIKGPVQAISAT